MKGKRIIAMFVTSIVALVASISITLGVALAWADPVAATDLSEISFKVSSNGVARDVAFDPTSAFNNDVAEAIIINSYSDILYADEALVDQIKLIKVSITNDTEAEAKINIVVSSKSDNDATAYAKFALFDVAQIRYEQYEVAMFNEFGHLPYAITLAAGETGEFVIAAYVSDQFVAKEIALGGAENSIYTNIRLQVA